jgi:CheY-like chemotaxis protein
MTATSGKSILVVDDSEAEVELISLAIEEMKLPIRVGAASNGKDALDYLRCTGRHAGRPPGRPSFVLLDNKMPIMGGAEALAEIRKDPDLKGLAVVMFTGSAQAEDVTCAYDSLANSYVVKPMGAKAFSDCVREVVLYWTARNVS